MKTLPISRYRFFQKIQPLSLLKKITSKSATGYLQVFSTDGAWSIYVEDGKLIYACYSEKMFEPLYRNLQRLSQQISTLPRGINEQLQTIFEKGIENQAIPNPDYLAICWLVNQKYISPLQAALLIERLAIEVVTAFLELQEGSYEFVPESFLDDMPKFCHLNLRSLVEQCQGKTNVSLDKYSQFWEVNQPEPQGTNSRPVNNYSYRRNSPAQTNKKPYTIVCIHDCPLVLDKITDFLDDKIFSVIGITDSCKALIEIIRIKPDLIFLDVGMPNLDGYQVCSLLRKHAYFKKTPVIMVTDKPGLIDRAKAKMVKATGHLPKPFNQGDLLKIIFQHIV
jgi:CheY-like chemotaxis protein